MNQRFVFSLCVMCLSLLACRSSSHQSSFEIEYMYTGVWHDRSGLDGCSWMIQLKNSNIQNQEWLIPLNASEFNVEAEEGKVIHFNCMPVQQMNVCMAGITVKLSAVKK